MVTKTLFYTDPHITCVAPRHRCDDYGQAILAKLHEAYALADSEGCDFITLGGDLFNHHRIFSYELINDLMDILCQTKLETYAVVGQHDIHAYNPETFKSSTLAFVSRHCPHLHILWEPTEVCGVVLHPSHVWDPVENALKPKVLDPAKLNVLVAHHLIHNQKKAFETVPTTFFADGPYDVVLSGDWHGGFEPHEHKGKWFCNPGSLARRAIDEIDRLPQVAILELEKGSIPIIDQRILKAARPGKEVFGQEVMEIIKKGQEEFDPSVFIENIEEFEAESVDIHELVQKAGQAKGIRKEILEYLGTKRT
jgi:DNA repair exonuclease SbcCD nuclease subunit